MDLGLVLIMAMAGAVLLWRIPGECKCQYCQKHTDERKQRERDLAAKMHDMQHKGYRGRPSDPDLYRCNEPRCPRNPPGPRAF